MTMERTPDPDREPNDKINQIVNGPPLHSSQPGAGEEISNTSLGEADEKSSYEDTLSAIEKKVGRWERMVNERPCRWYGKVYSTGPVSAETRRNMAENLWGTDLTPESFLAKEMDLPPFLHERVYESGAYLRATSRQKEVWHTFTRSMRFNKAVRRHSAKTAYLELNPYEIALPESYFLQLGGCTREEFNAICSSPYSQGSELIRKFDEQILIWGADYVHPFWYEVSKLSHYFWGGAGVQGNA